MSIPSGIGKAMVAKWGGKCLRCGGYIGEGEDMVWCNRGIAHRPELSCGPNKVIHNEAAHDEHYTNSPQPRRKLHPRIARRKAMGLQ